MSVCVYSTFPSRTYHTCIHRRISVQIQENIRTLCTHMHTHTTQILAEDITPSLEKLRKERAQYMAWSTANAQVERLERFCTAWEFTQAEVCMYVHVYVCMPCNVLGYHSHVQKRTLKTGKQGCVPSFACRTR